MFSWFSLPKKVDEVNRKVDRIMALGTETTKALSELRATIQAETDQAAERIAQLVQDAASADQVTADAIRAELAGVAGIIPDAVEETDIPTAETPEGEPSEETVPGE